MEVRTVSRAEVQLIVFIALTLAIHYFNRVLTHS